METVHFSSLEKVIKEHLVLGIGKFDGLHLGHRAVIRAIMKEAEKEALLPAIFTFRNFPVKFLISGWEEKLELLKQAGIELCIWCDFKEISGLSAEDFLDILAGAGVKKIVVGERFHFGEGRKGGIALLKAEGSKKGFIPIVVPPEKINGEVVNSTKIRGFIQHGEIEKANEFLGRCLSVEGRVVRGKRIGKVLGFPTANLLLRNSLDISEGVYAGRVKYRGRFYLCALNIGPSPTFSDKEKKFEVFMLDFEKDLYGEILKVYPVQKVRGIKKFRDAEELKAQISKDVKTIKAVLERKFPLQ